MNAAGADDDAEADGRPFPWGEAIRFGLARLRLPPEQFWRLTPRELAEMAGVRPGEAPIRRDRLDELMRLFPDEARDDRDW